MADFGAAFALQFNFSRGIAAPYRLADGSLATAPVDVPRRDHDATGRPLGLLIEPGARAGLGDRVEVREGNWERPGAATVLTEVISPTGATVRRALYTNNARATMTACLLVAGHHRSLGAVEGWLRNLGGFVRFRGEDWALPAQLVDDAGRALVDDAGHLLIDG